MRTTHKIAGAVVIAGLVGIGGSAFTAGGSLPSAQGVQSYASQDIQGVTATSVTYNSDPTGATYTSVALELQGDTTSKTIQIAFNDAAPATCSDAGTYDAVGDASTYTCALSPAVDVNSATKFALVAS